MRPRSPGFIKALANAEMIDTGVLNTDGTPAAELPANKTKGNILAADGATYNALAVGTDTHVLTADSTEDGGVKWAAAAGGASDLATVLAVGTSTGANDISLATGQKLTSAAELTIDAAPGSNSSSVNGGDQTTTGNGGNANLRGGNGGSTSGDGGSATLKGGDSTADFGGVVTIKGGTSTSNFGGGVTIDSGASGISTSSPVNISLANADLTTISTSSAKTQELRLNTGAARKVTIMGSTNTNSTTNIDAGATGDLTLGARSGSVTLNQSGDTALSGFTATSIIGSLNELKSGAAVAFGPRFTGTNLARYNNALMFTFGLDDPVGSKEAVGLVGGCPFGGISLATGAATFGSTSIVGAGTSVAVTAAQAPNFVLNQSFRPSRSSHHTFSFWFQGSVDPAASRNLIGWHQSGLSAGRLLYGWRDSPNFSLYALDINNIYEVWPVPTSYAVDIGDNTPHHMVFRYLDGSFDAFVDGVKGTTISVPNWAAEPQLTAGVEFIFCDGIPLDGSYAHVSGWSAGLSDAAVAELYNSGSGRFADGT